MRREEDRTATADAVHGAKATSSQMPSINSGPSPTETRTNMPFTPAPTCVASKRSSDPTSSRWLLVSGVTKAVTIPLSFEGDVRASSLAVELESVGPHIRSFINAYAHTEADRRRAHERNLDLLEAIKSRNPKVAAKMARAHLQPCLKSMTQSTGVGDRISMVNA